MYQVQSAQTSVEKHFRLSMEHARRLSHLARARGIDEDQVVENLKPILFALDPARIIYRVGALTLADLVAVDGRLRSALGL